MKKSLFIILSALIMVSASAQITINSSNIGSPGSEYYMAYDTDPDTSLKIGEAGPNKFWDFSSLDASYTDTVRYFHPDSTPYAGRFPQSNLALLQNEGTVWGFLVNNTFELSIYGAVLPVPQIGIVDFDIVPKDVMAFWPLEYQDSTDLTFIADVRVESTEPLIDSIRYKSTTFKSSTVDAWGTMAIPIGTFPTLRVFEKRIMIDSIWTKFIGTWIFVSRTVDSIKLYNWWTDHPASGYYLVSANLDAETMDIDDISYLNYPYVDIAEKELNHKELLVYPNPVDEILHVQMTVSSRKSQVAKIEDFRYEILNIAGRIVQEGILYTGDINVRSLNSGLYLVRITDGTVSQTARFIKQ